MWCVCGVTLKHTHTAPLFKMTTQHKHQKKQLHGLAQPRAPGLFGFSFVGARGRRRRRRQPRRVSDYLPISPPTDGRRSSGRSTSTRSRCVCARHVLFLGRRRRRAVGQKRLHTHTHTRTLSHTHTHKHTPRNDAQQYMYARHLCFRERAHHPETHNLPSHPPFPHKHAK